MAMICDVQSRILVLGIPWSPMVMTPCFYAKSASSFPGWGTRIPQTMQCSQKRKKPNILEGLFYSPLPTQPSLAAILFPQFSRLPSQEERGSPNATGLSLAYFGTWPLHVCSVAFSGLIPYLGIRELLGVLMDHMVQE